MKNYTNSVYNRCMILGLLQITNKSGNSIQSYSKDENTTTSDTGGTVFLYYQWADKSIKALGSPHQQLLWKVNYNRRMSKHKDQRCKNTSNGRCVEAAEQAELSRAQPCSAEPSVFHSAGGDRGGRGAPPKQHLAHNGGRLSCCCDSSAHFQSN